MCCDLCGDFIKYLDGIERFWKLYMYIGSRLASENTEIETLPHISSFCRIYFSSHKNEIGSRRRDEPREKTATENEQIVYTSRRARRHKKINVAGTKLPTKCQ